MKPRRFILSIVTTAREGTPRLPFERGVPRAAMIARRKAAPSAPAQPAPHIKRA